MSKVTAIHSEAKTTPIIDEVPEFIRVAALVGLATFLTYLAQGLTDFVADIGRK